MSVFIVTIDKNPELDDWCGESNLRILGVCSSIPECLKRAQEWIDSTIEWESQWDEDYHLKLEINEYGNQVTTREGELVFYFEEWEVDGGEVDDFDARRPSVEGDDWPEQTEKEIA